jgi:small GTP-binding protein
MLIDEVPYRIIFLGDSAVGKTAIISRLVHDRVCTTDPATSVSSYLLHRILIDGRSISLELCDTAGQERYRALGNIYYRNADVAIFVFSLASYDSFANVEEWIASFRQVVPDDTLMYVVGNKSDLIDEREVSIEMATEWAERFVVPVFFTSALIGDGVVSLFQQIGKDVLMKSVVPKATLVDSELKPLKKKKCCDG